MRNLLAVLALCAALVVPAHAGPSEDFRAKFKPYEQWMLDVVLSDPKQKTLFDVDAVNAAKGPAELANATMKWRKTLISFAQYYKKHLDTVDIVPNSPTVEKMVSAEEFNVTQYYWLRKPEKEREAMKSDIATGNNLLEWGGRGVVEGKVRAGRTKFSGDLGEYLDSPDSKAALAYVPPAAPVVPTAPVVPAQPPARKNPPVPPVVAEQPVKKPVVPPARNPGRARPVAGG